MVVVGLLQNHQPTVYLPQLLLAQAAALEEYLGLAGRDPVVGVGGIGVYMAAWRAQPTCRPHQRPLPQTIVLSACP